MTNKIDQREIVTLNIQTNNLLKKFNKNIIFVGLMGAGKTTVGKKISKILDLPFFDSDKEIEKRYKTSISNIFFELGEEKFREYEENIIFNILKKSPIVLSTGGGAFCNNKIRNFISKNSISFWLNVKPENLFKRIKNTSSRPLLNSKDPLLKLKSILLERENLYKKANFEIKTDNLTTNETINKILYILKCKKTFNDFKV